MTEQAMSNFDEMVSNLRENHIPAFRQIRALAITTHKVAREICGVACVYARSLQNDAGRRAEFYAEAFPNKFKRFNPRKLLLHVLMGLYGVTNCRCVGYSTASAHSVALRGIYSNGNVADDDVMRHIEASGIFAGWKDDDDAESDGDDDRSQGAVLQPRVKPASIFSDQDDDDLVADDEEAGHEDGASVDNDNVVRLPVRKPPKPAAQLPRLPWRYVELCVLGRPRPEDRETILGSLRDGKSVWVKLTPGGSIEYELDKGGGPFIETQIEDFEIEGK